MMMTSSDWFPTPSDQPPATSLQGALCVAWMPPSTLRHVPLARHVLCLYSGSVIWWSSGCDDTGINPGAMTRNDCTS
jgi:hypothetical protein